MQLAKAEMAQIYELRRARKTGDEIALLLGYVAIRGVWRVTQTGVSRLSSLEPKTQVQRDEWDSPGDMLHVDIKRNRKIDGSGHRKAGTRQVKLR